jgi:alanyl-tRNA synthetase
MLGNWSLGDYFKEGAITYSFEFLTQVLQIPIAKLYISCYAGDETVPRDEEAAKIWMSLGIPADHIQFLGREHNWWGPAGETGPCGPDTEMFIELKPACGPNCDLNCKCGRFVEIWNDVFMQYNKNHDGSYEPLAQKNVDTGMGLERVTAIMQGKKSCFETEIFQPLLQKLGEICGKTDLHTERSGRIVVEHLRTSTFLIGDGVHPGNVDQGYVLRRLIRRAIREGRKLGINEPFCAKIAEVVIANYGTVYPGLAANRDDILASLTEEEIRFAETLEHGTVEFQKLIDRIPAHVQNKVIAGRKAFDLYQTYGFPLELTVEMAAEKGFSVDESGFHEAYKKHQELSRAGAEQKFKGGLADNSDATSALHTATHLLHAGLRKVLGEHVAQAGSNITAERLRFDFSHPDKMTPEQIQAVEDFVNAAIAAKVDVICQEMSVEKAKEGGAIGLFEAKYGELVKVYNIPGWSCEICGGPHAGNTGTMGRFKIQKEESSSRGVRRIKAVLEK